MKIRRVAEGDLFDGQTQLVWVDSVREAGARANVAVFRAPASVARFSVPCSCTSSQLVSNRGTTGTRNLAEQLQGT